MGGIVASLANAPGAATTTGGFYQNAADEMMTATGSPAASRISAMQAAALRPQFQDQTDALTAQLAAEGLGHSGAGRAAMGNLGGEQAAALAGVTAPLYQGALQDYGQIIGAMPGAQTSAYQGAIQDLYGGIGSLGQAVAMGGFGAMPFASGGGGGGGFPATPPVPYQTGANEYTTYGNPTQQAGGYYG